MAPPPAKRQKRRVVLSSDEDGPDDAPPSKQLDSKVTTASTRSTSNDNANRQLPTRSRTKPKSDQDQNEADSASQPFTRRSKAPTKQQSSKSISTFFNHTNQVHKTSRQTPKTASPPAEIEVEDLIEDVSPDDEIEEQRRIQNKTRSVLDRRKKVWEDKPPSGSQQFKLRNDSTNLSTAKVTKSHKIDSRPWTDKFGPSNLDELVVHKKKVSDVRNWVENVLQGRDRKRLLILRGPSGSGKTATITTLAKAMDFELSEWRNPVGSEFSSEGYSSMSAQFEDFIGRSGRFSKLELVDNGGRMNESPELEAKQHARKKVILLEEFPNTFLTTSTALQSFRSSILGFLAVSMPAMDSILAKKHVESVTPIIMIVTETRLTTTTSARDSFTAHRLLGTDILSHPGVSIIEFNPVAPTLLIKALDLVIQKEARQSGRRRVPGPSVLKKLGEVGDMRSAIGSLEFLCLRAEDSDDWGGRVAAKGKKGANFASAITRMEEKSLEMITQRESSLDLFHAVGKVVYNKRDDCTESLLQPPPHISEHARTRMSQVSVESLINETGTDVETFISALHENFVLSCEGISFIDTLNDCFDNLSDSDLISGKVGSNCGFGDRSFREPALDSLRQEEICFQLAVRGLLFALPDPVKRRVHPIAGKSGGKGDAHKVFFPTSMRLSRQMEEIDECVDRWLERLGAGVTPIKKSASTCSKQTVGMGSKEKGSFSNNATKRGRQIDNEGSEPVRTSLNCTKTELLLERLPYITKIEQQIPNSSTARELGKITQLYGITPLNRGLSEDEEDVEEPITTTDWTTDRPAGPNVEDLAVPQQNVGHVQKDVATLALPPASEEVEKMYLSDDDIEDYMC
ncbi:RFC checkpoint protein Rad17 [Lecanora helva]